MGIRMATVSITRKKFTDIDLSFARHPLTNDVAKTVDVKAVTQALKNLIMTREYESPFHPEIASPVAGMLFEQMDEDDMASMKRRIEYLVINFEPRVSLINTAVVPDYGQRSLYVTIVFRVVGMPSTYTVNFNMTRLI